MEPILKDTSMQLHRTSESGLFNPRVLLAFVLCSVGIVLGMFGVAARPSAEATPWNKPVPRTSFDSSQMAVRSALEAGVIPPQLRLPSGMTTSRRDPLGNQFFGNPQFNSQTSATASYPNVPAISAAAAEWSIVPSPNGGAASTFLSAVTCVTSSDCWAVGRTESGYSNTVLMHWDGDSWTLAPSPSVANAANGLVDITCVSSSSCWAVGYLISLFPPQVKTLTLHWDGVSWASVPSPNVGNGFNALYGIACASDSNCWAVGFNNGGSQAKTLTEKWDGNSWTIQGSPNVGSQHNVFNAVTCLSGSDCWAVGYSGAEGAKSSLVARWNGSAWAASTLPNELLAQENNLTSVTCTSTSDCWAVGDSYNGTTYQTLIEQWNGTSWTSVTTPITAVESHLSHVTCVSASDCWAVGRSNNTAVDPELVDQDLMLHWDGSVWLLSATAPDPTVTFASALAGVACVSGSECWAVGSIHPADSGRPHISRWNGTSWSSIAAPEVPPTRSNVLNGVTCLSESDCWAAGFAFYGVVARSLTIHWDGMSWGIIESPNTAQDRSNYLADIACASTSDCWAVGSSTNTIGVQDQTLAMHWNGSAWSIVSTAPINTSDVAEISLEGVTCVSSSDCWAVGYSLVDVKYQGIIEHWNGVAWVLIPAPPEDYDPSRKSVLYDVVCTSTSDCTAVGVQWTIALTGNGLYQTLVEHWDGISWSIVPSPNTSTEQDNILSSVKCNSPTDCWAVGTANNYSQALIERWDGTSWSIVDSSQANGGLTAVTCISAPDCWAAGPGYSPNSPAQTRLMHWDGTSWTRVFSPNTNPAQSNNLSGIACTSSSNCWAVGQYWTTGSPQTLTLHYAPSPPLPIDVVSHKIHGASSQFDVHLLPPNPGIEMRRNTGADVAPAPNAGRDHELIITFGVPVTVTGVTVATNNPADTPTPTGNVISGNGTAVITVDLHNIQNPRRVTITLNGVADNAGHGPGPVLVGMGVLLGDVNSNALVNSTDTSIVQSQSGQVLSSSNFPSDVNLNGLINSTDTSIVQSKSGTGLP